MARRGKGYNLYEEKSRKQAKYWNPIKNSFKGVAKAMIPRPHRKRRVYHSTVPSVSWDDISLTGKQLGISVLVGAIFASFAFVPDNIASGEYGAILAVAFFLFSIPFLMMVLVFMLYNKSHQHKQRTVLLNSRKIIAAAIALPIPALMLLSEAKTGNMTEAFCGAAVVFVLFYLAMCGVFRLYMPRNKQTEEPFTVDSKDDTAVFASEVEAETEGTVQETPEVIYTPNPDWIGEDIPIRNERDAQIMVPQLVKQVQESAKILNTTTDPAVFYPRWDFCIGRIQLLKKCSDYPTALRGDPQDNYLKMVDAHKRDSSAKWMIERTEEKYKTKIRSLKTKKARINWATKFHDAFNEYVPYMSDDQLSALGESSARLLELAEADPLEE